MSSPPSNLSRMTPAAIAMLAVIVMVALGLRLYALGGHPFSLDEFWNAELSTGRGTLHETPLVDVLHTPPPGTSLDGAPAWWTIPGSLDRVTHPPLYSIALRVWREAIGSSDATMRAYSVFTASLAILPIFATVRGMHGTRVALWACAMYAVAATPIACSREVRPYGQLILLSWLAVWQVTRIERTGQATWTSAGALGLTALATMFTHYFSVGLMGALAVYACFRFPRPALRRVVVTVGLAGVVFAASWAPTMIRQHRNAGAEAAEWLADPDPHPVRMTLLRAADWPLRLLITPRNETYPTPYVAIGFVLAAAALSWWKRDLAIWVFILGGVGGLIFLLDLLQHSRMLDFPRYTVTAAPAMGALVAAVLCGLRSWIGQALPAVVTGSLLISLPTGYLDEDLDYEKFAAFLDQRVDPGRDVVVFARKPDWEWKAGYLYVVWSHYSKLEARPRVAFTSSSPPVELQNQLRAIAEAGGKVWFVSSDAPVLELLESLPGWRDIEHRGFLLIGDVSRIVPSEPTP